MSVKYSSRYEISMTSASLPKMILMGESSEHPALSRKHLVSKILLKFQAFTRVSCGYRDFYIVRIILSCNARSESPEISAPRGLAVTYLGLSRFSPGFQMHY